MFLSLSSALAKIVVFMMSLLVFYSPIDNITSIVRGSGDEDSKTVSADTTKAEEGSKKLLRISISDRGIKVKSDREGNIVLEVESDVSGKVKRVTSTLTSVEADQDYDVKGSDIVRFGRDIFIDRDEVVRGSAVVFGGDIIVKGKVFGDVVAIGGDVELDSTAIVNGDVVTVFGDMERHEGSVVRGEIAEVGGTGFKPIVLDFGYPGAHPLGFGLIRAGGRVVIFVVLALLMMLVLYLLSDRMKKASEVASTSFLKSLGVGFVVAIVGLIVVSILAFIIGITIIGIPISILLLFSFAALILIGQYVGAYALGEFVSRKFGFESSSMYVKGFLGLFLIYLFGIIAGFLYMNPWLTVPRVVLGGVGKLLVFVATMIGLGAFIISKAGSHEVSRRIPTE